MNDITVDLGARYGRRVHVITKTKKDYCGVCVIRAWGEVQWKWTETLFGGWTNFLTWMLVIPFGAALHHHLFEEPSRLDPAGVMVIIIWLLLAFCPGGVVFMLVGKYLVGGFWRLATSPFQRRRTQ